MRAGTPHTRWLTLVLVSALVAVGPVPASAADDVVILDNNQFIPGSPPIALGDEVVWINEEDQAHTVTFDDGSFDSHPGCPGGVLRRCMEEDEQVRRTFDEPGEFTYFCKLHRQEGMVGVVVVEGDDDEDDEDDEESTTTSEPSTTTSSSTSSTSTTSTSTTTTTMRELATSSSVAPLATSSAAATTPPETRPPAEAPVFDPPEGTDGEGGEASGSGSDDGGSGTAGLIVVLLLAAAGAGGFLLWRLRPRSGA